MLRPLIVGLGRSGAGLHLRTLTRMRAGAGSATPGPPPDPGPGQDQDGAHLPPLPPLGPPVGCDPRPEAGAGLPGVTVTRSPAEAARLLDPAAAVVHVCTPPAARTPVVAELAELGFTRLLVEKPLTSDPAELDALLALRRRHRLDLAVVAHWGDARLTRRLRRLVRERQLGELRAIEVAQHKPRFARTLATAGHASALEVEVPHSLGVVLDLAGPADLLDAAWSDLRAGPDVRPRMGGARLSLLHRGGVRTHIVSDLTSPVQQRSVTLRFTDGTATGHYPLSEADHHAQLVVDGPGGRRHEVFADDALTAFLHRAYADFAAGRPADATAAVEVSRLLCAARRRAAAHTGGAASRQPAAAPPPSPRPAPPEDAHAR